MAITAAGISYAGTRPRSTHTFGNLDSDIYFIPINVTFDASYDGTNGEAITAATLGVSEIIDAWTCGGIARDSSSGKGYPVHVTFSSDGSTLVIRLFQYNGSNTGAQALDHTADTTVTTNVSLRMTVVAKR